MTAKLTAPGLLQAPDGDALSAAAGDVLVRLPAELRPPRNLLPLDVLTEQASQAARELLAESETENTQRSYASASAYWQAWFRVRYGQPLCLPAPWHAAVQFILDHHPRATAQKGVFKWELPERVDQALVAAKQKRKLGPFKIATIEHRLVVLSNVHRKRFKQPELNPCLDARVRELLKAAKKSAGARGPRKKTALAREPLELMLATCNDSLGGLRDRALLLFGWSSGGRRRSEIAGATMENLSTPGRGEYSYRLVRAKTKDQTPNKPIRGRAAEALRAWLTAANIHEGPIFRRVFKGGRRTGVNALSDDAVAAIVKGRAKAADLKGDWGGHSLRSGFVTECGRRKIPPGEAMALTGHKKLDTFMKYYQAGDMQQSEAANLLDAGSPSKT